MFEATPFVLVTPTKNVRMQSVKKKHGEPANTNELSRFYVNLWNQSCVNRYAPRESKFVRVEVPKR